MRAARASSRQVVNSDHLQGWRVREAPGGEGGLALVPRCRVELVTEGKVGEEEQQEHPPYWDIQVSRSLICTLGYSGFTYFNNDFIYRFMMYKFCTTNYAVN